MLSNDIRVIIAGVDMSYLDLVVSSTGMSVSIPYNSYRGKYAVKPHYTDITDIHQYERVPVMVTSTSPLSPNTNRSYPKSASRLNSSVLFEGVIDELIVKKKKDHDYLRISAKRSTVSMLESTVFSNVNIGRAFTSISNIKALQESKKTTEKTGSAKISLSPGGSGLMSVASDIFYQKLFTGSANPDTIKSPHDLLYTTIKNLLLPSEFKSIEGYDYLIAPPLSNYPNLLLPEDTLHSFYSEEMDFKDVKHPEFFSQKKVPLQYSVFRIFSQRALAAKKIPYKKDITSSMKKLIKTSLQYVSKAALVELQERKTPGRSNQTIRENLENYEQWLNPYDSGIPTKEKIDRILGVIRYDSNEKISTLASNIKALRDRISIIESICFVLDEEEIDQRMETNNFKDNISSVVSPAKYTVVEELLPTRGALPTKSPMLQKVDVLKAILPASIRKELSDKEIAKLLLGSSVEQARGQFYSFIIFLRNALYSSFVSTISPLLVNTVTITYTERKKGVDSETKKRINIADVMLGALDSETQAITENETLIHDISNIFSFFVETWWESARQITGTFFKQYEPLQAANTNSTKEGRLNLPSIYSTNIQKDYETAQNSSYVLNKHETGDIPREEKELVEFLQGNYLSGFSSSFLGIYTKKSIFKLIEGFSMFTSLMSTITKSAHKEQKALSIEQIESSDSTVQKNLLTTLGDSGLYIRETAMSLEERINRKLSMSSGVRPINNIALMSNTSVVSTLSGDPEIAIAGTNGYRSLIDKIVFDYKVGGIYRTNSDETDKEEQKEQIKSLIAGMFLRAFIKSAEVSDRVIGIVDEFKKNVEDSLRGSDQYLNASVSTETINISDKKGKDLDNELFSAIVNSFKGLYVHTADSMLGNLRYDQLQLWDFITAKKLYNFNVKRHVGTFPNLEALRSDHIFPTIKLYNLENYIQGIQTTASRATHKSSLYTSLRRIYKNMFYGMQNPLQFPVYQSYDADLGMVKPDIFLQPKGALVLPPKCNVYIDDNTYSDSLKPSTNTTVFRIKTHSPIEYFSPGSDIPHESYIYDILNPELIQTEEQYFDTDTRLLYNFDLQVMNKHFYELEQIHNVDLSKELEFLQKIQESTDIDESFLENNPIFSGSDSEDNIIDLDKLCGAYDFEEDMPEAITLDFSIMKGNDPYGIQEKLTAKHTEIVDNTENVQRAEGSIGKLNPAALTVDVRPYKKVSVNNARVLDIWGLLKEASSTPPGDDREINTVNDLFYSTRPVESGLFTERTDKAGIYISRYNSSHLEEASSSTRYVYTGGLVGDEAGGDTEKYYELLFDNDSSIPVTIGYFTTVEKVDDSKLKHQRGQADVTSDILRILSEDIPVVIEKALYVWYIFSVKRFVKELEAAIAKNSSNAIYAVTKVLEDILKKEPELFSKCLNVSFYEYYPDKDKTVVEVAVPEESVERLIEAADRRTLFDKHALEDNDAPPGNTTYKEYLKTYINYFFTNYINTEEAVVLTNYNNVTRLLSHLLFVSSIRTGGASKYTFPTLLNTAQVNTERIGDYGSSPNKIFPINGIEGVDTPRTIDDFSVSCGYKNLRGGVLAIKILEDDWSVGIVKTGSMGLLDRVLQVGAIEKTVFPSYQRKEGFPGASKEHESFQNTRTAAGKYLKKVNNILSESSDPKRPTTIFNFKSFNAVAVSGWKGSPISKEESSVAGSVMEYIRYLVLAGVGFRWYKTGESGYRNMTEGFRAIMPKITETLRGVLQVNEVGNVDAIDYLSGNLEVEEFFQKIHPPVDFTMENGERIVVTGGFLATRKTSIHTGVDFAPRGNKILSIVNNSGIPLYAPSDGWVTYSIQNFSGREENLYVSGYGMYSMFVSKKEWEDEDSEYIRVFVYGHQCPHKVIKLLQEEYGEKGPADAAFQEVSVGGITAYCSQYTYEDNRKIRRLSSSQATCVRDTRKALNELCIEVNVGDIIGYLGYSGVCRSSSKSRHSVSRGAHVHYDVKKGYPSAVVPDRDSEMAPTAKQIRSLSNYCSINKHKILKTYSEVRSKVSNPRESQTIQTMRLKLWGFFEDCRVTGRTFQEEDISVMDQAKAEDKQTYHVSRKTVLALAYRIHSKLLAGLHSVDVPQITLPYHDPYFVDGGMPFVVVRNNDIIFTTLRSITIRSRNQKNTTSLSFGKGFSLRQMIYYYLAHISYKSYLVGKPGDAEWFFTNLRVLLRKYPMFPFSTIEEYNNTILNKASMDESYERMFGRGLFSFDWQDYVQIKVPLEEGEKPIIVSLKTFIDGFSQFASPEADRLAVDDEKMNKIKTKMSDIAYFLDLLDTNKDFIKIDIKKLQAENDRQTQSENFTFGNLSDGERRMLLAYRRWDYNHVYTVEKWLDEFAYPGIDVLDTTGGQYMDLYKIQSVVPYEEHTSRNILSESNSFLGFSDSWINSKMLFYDWTEIFRNIREESYNSST